MSKNIYIDDYKMVGDAHLARRTSGYGFEGIDFDPDSDSDSDSR